MKILMRVFLASLLALFGISCKNKDEQQNKQWVDPASLKQGPIRREALSSEQMERIRKLRESLAEVDRSPLEKWVDDFKRDADPDRELAIWERIASAYVRYCSRKQLSLEAKEDVFRVLLLRSTTSEEETLKHLNLKTLSIDEVREVLKEF